MVGNSGSWISEMAFGEERESLLLRSSPVTPGRPARSLNISGGGGLVRGKWVAGGHNRLCVSLMIFNISWMCQSAEQHWGTGHPEIVKMWQCWRGAGRIRL